MSVNSESISKSTTTVLDEPTNSGVYASLFEKINLTPVSQVSDINIFQDNSALQIQQQMSALLLQFKFFSTD